MSRKVVRFLFLFLILNIGLVRKAPAAETSARPEVGVGYTDNVYEDDNFKKADGFIWAQGLIKYTLADADLTLKLNFNLYHTESSNNFMNYSVNYLRPFLNRDMDLSFSVGGFHYLEGIVPGAKDESFDQVFAALYLTKDLVDTDEFYLNFEPGLRVTSYPELDRRKDLSASVRLNAEWSLNESDALNPYTEFTYTDSNQDYYKRRYVDAGVTWNHYVNEVYSTVVDLFLRRSVYPVRTVQDILNLRPFLTTTTTATDKELSRFAQLMLTLKRTTGNRELNLSYLYARQQTDSHLEDFTENQVLASVLWVF